MSFSLTGLQAKIPLVQNELKTLSCIGCITSFLDIPIVCLRWKGWGLPFSIACSKTANLSPYHDDHSGF